MAQIGAKAWALRAAVTRDPERVRARIRATLARAGTVDLAARALGVAPRTLYRLMRELEIRAAAAG